MLYLRAAVVKSDSESEAVVLEENVSLSPAEPSSSQFEGVSVPNQPKEVER